MINKELEEDLYDIAVWKNGDFGEIQIGGYKVLYGESIDCDEEHYEIQSIKTGKIEMFYGEVPLHVMDTLKDLGVDCVRSSYTIIRRKRYGDVKKY